MTLLSIIIPVYNEERTIIQILEKINEVDVKKEIIIVDDKSTDGTRQLVEAYAKDKPNMKFIAKSYNSGRSQTFLEGLKISKGEIIIPQDADLEYDPHDYPKLIKPIIDGKCEVVFGSRVLGDDGYSVDAFYSTFGLRFLNWIQNFLYGTNYTDSCTCYITIKKSLLERIDLSKTKNFTFNATITSNLAKMKIPVIEVGIRYKPRKWTEGKKVKIFRDGREHIWTLFKEKFSS